MERLTQRQRRWTTAIAITVIVLMTTYVALDILGVLRNRGPALLAMPLPHPGERVLVIAPHEDDETLGCGGYMQAAVDAGVEVYVCLMTAGEGEELGAVWASRSPDLSPQDFVRLGQIRERESLRALTSIGIPPDHVIFLNYPNTGLAAMWTARYFDPANPWTSRYTRTTHSPFSGGLTPQAPFCGAAVLADLETVLKRVQPTQVFVTHPGDIHPDHWPTYCFTRLALAKLAAGHAVPLQVRLYTYLVHRRGWPTPWGYYPYLRLTPPPALAELPLNRWLTFPLGIGQISQKNRMIVDYHSQAAAFDFLLRAFARRNEIFALVSDVAMLDGTVADRTLLEEPTRETEFLRHHPEADLAWVDLCYQGSATQVSFGVVGDVKGSTIAMVNLMVVAPPDKRPRGLLVQYQKGKPLMTWLDAGAGVVPAPAPLPITATQVGNRVIVTLPADYAGGGGPVLLDVWLRTHRHIVDHALTRLFQPAAPAATAEKVETRG